MCSHCSSSTASKSISPDPLEGAFRLGHGQGSLTAISILLNTTEYKRALMASSGSAADDSSKPVLGDAEMDMVLEVLAMAGDAAPPPPVSKGGMRDRDRDRDPLLNLLIPERMGMGLGGGTVFDGCGSLDALGAFELEELEAV
jgi:hypothetical protein